MQRIKGTCACGAAVDIESSFYTEVERTFNEWQEAHKGHVKASGEIAIPGPNQWPEVILTDGRINTVPQETRA